MQPVGHLAYLLTASDPAAAPADVCANCRVSLKKAKIIGLAILMYTFGFV
jgi:hypothetical protein